LKNVCKALIEEVKTNMRVERLEYGNGVELGYPEHFDSFKI